MAGHSKFKNIQHRKGAQDKKRAKIFTKLIREIVNAARLGGVDVDMNPRLRLAISTARSNNLPNDNINRALARVDDKDYKDNYSEIIYEAYGPGGVALVIDTLTDNKNRTVSEIRAICTKYGGNLAENGAVSFLFDKVGLINYRSDILNSDDILEKIIDFDVKDIESDEGIFKIYVGFSDINNCASALEGDNGEVVDYKIEWKPFNYVESLDEKNQEKLSKLLDMLNNQDDVQQVFSNYSEPSE